MGTYIKNSPKVNLILPKVGRTISNPACVAASAVLVLALWLPSAVCAQYGGLLPQFSSSQPQFTNTIVEPTFSSSPSVRMKLSRKKVEKPEEAEPQSEPKASPFRSPLPPRLAATPKSYLSPARFRRQDDVFGEDQAGGGNPFGDATVESPIQESPFEPYNSTTIPRRKKPLENPFGEPEVKTPVVDPTPRTPKMDTPVRPVLPQGSEFTPDPDSIPDLPTPSGGKRESEKARTEKRVERSLPDPDEVDIDQEFSADSIIEEEDPDARSTPPKRPRRDRKDTYDDPRRPYRSNVYRPAPDPSYYTKPLASDPQLPVAGGPYAPGANPYAYNPYAANPYLTNPYPVDSYAAPHEGAYAAAYPAPYAAPYAMNPYMGYGCPPACMGCQSCQSCAPRCPQTNCYDGCPTPTPADGQEVYDAVVSAPAPERACGLGVKLCRGGDNSIFSPAGVPLYYFSLFGGWSDLSDLEIVNGDGTINLDSRNGVGLGGAFGQIQGRNLRSELEFSYRSHDIEDLLLRDFAGGSETLTGIGDIQSYAGMLNVYWEFVDLLGGRIAPYIGAGIGAVNVNAETRLDGGTDAFADGEDSSFAYQYIAGLNFKVRQYSDLFIEYRHFAADSLRFDAALPEGALINGDGELNYQTNNIFFGMRLKF